MKKIVILGSTGSIGTQTLEVLREQGGYEVAGLAAGSCSGRLEEQIREFSPQTVCVFDPAGAEELKKRISGGTEIVSGMDGLVHVASACGADIVLTAVVGMVGIHPTLAAIEAGSDIALANKETLVTAGHLIMPAIRRRGVRLFPVDSEHSAVFQCLQGETEAGNPPERIWLTCSGGPFLGRKRQELSAVTVEDALRHPSWSMGKKITVDSATLVNKGLEVMEAAWLFQVPFDRIRVVIHPGSVIHSMVEFADGAVKAQLGTPDMKLPIMYALYFPERRLSSGSRLDFTVLGSLRFAPPDEETFPALPMAYEAGRKGGSMPTVYNAANEWAVAAFLAGRLPFLQITEAIRRAMDHHESALIREPDLTQILETENETRSYLESRYGF